MAHRNKFISASDALKYITAGNATFTVVSVATQARFTFRVQQAEPKEDERLTEQQRAALPFFVTVLTDSDNNGRYTYMGTIFQRRAFKFTAKSKIGKEAPSAKAFMWIWYKLNTGELPATVEVWHEGACGKCGRKLTVPSSIASGLGPICAGAVTRIKASAAAVPSPTTGREERTPSHLGSEGKPGKLSFRKPAEPAHAN